MTDQRSRPLAPLEDALHNRIWARDHTVWKNDPREITDRLGWLDVAEELLAQADDLEAFGAEVVSDGIEHVVLLGMGGSSLGPEVLKQTFGIEPGRPELIVLDSTIPATIAGVRQAIDPAKTLFLVSSKSGTTVEPLALYAYFRAAVEEAVGKSAVGGHFVAVTDAGTPLQRLGTEAEFRKVYCNRPDIGGRYSVLSHFGMVPAALAGYDIRGILESAVEAARASGSGQGLREAPAGSLAVNVAEALRSGRDKLTFHADPPFSSFGLWAEQLLAESTGKEGVGIIPVAGEPVGGPQSYSGDRQFVCLHAEGKEVPMLAGSLSALEDAGHPVHRQQVRSQAEIGALFFDWEFATAVLGAALGINPFDQPNVQQAKDRTNEVIAEYERSSTPPEKGDVGSFAELIGSARPGDYLAIMPFGPQTAESEGAVQELRRAVGERYRLATTVGYGPRFLHSTGQLHKGGPNNLLALQITVEHTEDATIPGLGYSFGTLADAQAAGDFQALKEAGRRAARVNAGASLPEAVQSLMTEI